MSNEGIPLPIIQEVSGRRSLAELKKYLEVSPDRFREAVLALLMLSPVGKPTFNDSPKEKKKVPQKTNIFSSTELEND